VAHNISQIQVLNQYDECCFDDPRYPMYVYKLQDILHNIGDKFQIVWSEGEFGYRVNSDALRSILLDLETQMIAK